MQEKWGSLAEPNPVTIILLPVALVIGFILSKLGFISQLLWYFVTIPFHETGHAVGAWLGSRFAFPIGALLPMAGFTMMGSERSFLFGTLDFVGLVFLVRWGWKERNAPLLALATLVGFLWIRWTFFSTPMEWARFSIWAGVGGEFFLPTTLILLSFYDLPEIAHWDFFRGPAVVYGGLGFSASFGRWFEILHGHSNLPMGSFLSGSSDANGDMERLIQVHGWTIPRITHSYFNLGCICGILIAIHWGQTLSRRFRTSQR